MKPKMGLKSPPEAVRRARGARDPRNQSYRFQLAISIVSRERRMMVVVEGRCLGCKQQGHIAKFCPQKAQQNAAVPTDTTVTTATISSEQSTKATTSKEPGPVQSKVSNQPNTDGGWTKVSRKKRKSPQKGEKKPVSASPAKDLGPKAVSTTEPIPVTSKAP